MAGMSVDFNGVRKRLIFTYEELVSKLNASIDEEGSVVVEAERIRRVMDDLREYVGLIAMVHDDKNPDFKDVFSEVFPEEKYKSGPCMTVFAPEPDEDE